MRLPTLFTIHYSVFIILLASERERIWGGLPLAENDNKLDEITGTVEDISFRNEQSGFTVAELDVEDDLVIAVGVLPPINAGEEVHMYGHWTTHPKFGRQFAAESCESKMPSGASAILRYLSSGAVP